MKKLLTILCAIGLMYMTGYSQNAGVGEPAGTPNTAGGDKVQERTSLEGLMGDLPEPVKAQVKEAVRKAEQAKKAIGEAQGTGGNEDAAKVMEQTREQAKKQLQEAIQKMENLNEEAKGKLTKTKDQVCQRLREKQSELEDAVKEQARKRDGTGKE